MLGMLFWVLAARMYESSYVGIAGSIIAAISLISIFSNFGFGISLICFLPRAKENANDLINTCFTLCSIASLFIAAIFIFGFNLWPHYIQSYLMKPLNLFLFMFFSIIWSLNSLVACVFLARRSTEFTLIQNAISGILKFVLLIILYMFIKDSFAIYFSVGASMSAALLIAIFLFIPRVQREYKPSLSIQKNVIKDISFYSGSNFVSRTFLEGIPMILPLMIINNLGAEMCAYFNMIWLIIGTIMFIPISICNSLFSEGSNDKGSIYENIRKSIRLLYITLIPIILIIMILAEKILLLFGPDYMQGASTMRIIAISIIPYSINYMYITISRIKMDVGNILIISTGITCITLILCNYFMLEMGLEGIGFGWLLGQTIIALPLILFIMKKLNKPLG